MFPFLLIYTLLGIAILLTNFRNPQSFWFFLVFAGFLTGCGGLAVYSEYLAYSTFTENHLFSGLSDIIWKINYLLDLELFDVYRIMNLGTVLYTMGALNFSVTLIPDRRIRSKKRIILFMGILFLILFDPEFIRTLFAIPRTPFDGKTVNANTTNLLKFWNLVGNILLKTGILLSICLMFRNYRKVIPVNKSRLMLTIISLTPIHMVFLVLFYWFPNHSVYYTRYAFLQSINMPYNREVYLLILVIASVSILVLTYSIYRFRILQMSTQRKELNFTTRVNTAEQGMKIFSHSIKNQFIAARLLISQISEGKLTDEGARETALRVEKICSDSIDQLGKLTRKTGTLSLNYTMEDLYRLLEEIIREYRVEYRAWEFHLKGEYGMLMIDKNHFQEVIRNLLSNSIEASEKSTLKIIWVKQYFKQNYCIISLKDTGPGIPDKIQKQVFNPFFTTKPSISNWGLGLSYCRNVMEAFGGSIEVASNAGNGTTVNIYLHTTERKK